MTSNWGREVEMSLKNWEEWIFSHACIVASLALVSVGLGALGGRILGEWCYGPR